MPLRWAVNKRSFKKRLKPRSAVKDLRRAHRVWQKAASDCPHEDAVGLSFLYIGRSKRTSKFDGQNVVEMRKLPRGTLMTTFTWYDETQVLESDIRFSKRTGWYGGVKQRRHYVAETSLRSNAARRHRPRRGPLYNVANAAVHAIGTQIGLEDLGEPHDELTMFGHIRPGETKKTSLGIGDLIGATSSSP